MKRTSLAAAGTALLLAGAILTLDRPSQAGTTTRALPELPQRYYLALGDSIAYGIQPAKVSAGLPPSGFHTGYVDVFAARLRTLAPKIQVVNYGCPGESTKTFISGGCPWLARGETPARPLQGHATRSGTRLLAGSPRPGQPDHLDAVGQRPRRGRRSL